MIVAFLFMVIGVCDGFLYELVLQERVFTPCKDYPDDYYHKYLTIPENFTIAPDDKLYVQGDYTLTYDFTGKKFPFVLDIFKKGRGGEWQKTLYGFSRNDLCASLIDSSELWFTYTKAIRKDQRVCPFYKGQKFSFDAVMEQTFDMPSNSLEGDYLFHIEIGTRNQPDGDFLCVDIFSNLYRV